MAVPETYDEHLAEMGRNELFEVAKRQGSRILALHMEIERLREALETISESGEPFAAEHAYDALKGKAWA